MHKIWLICKREYLSRVKKKSFLVMTLVSPLLIVLFYGIIFYFSFNRDLAEEKKLILVNDETGIFENKLEDTKTISFNYKKLSSDESKSLLENSGTFGILSIRKDANGKLEYDLLANEQPALTTLGSIEGKLETVLKNKELKERGLDEKILQQLNDISVQLSTRKNTEDGIEKGNSGVTTMIGFLGAFLIYFFIFLYGVQVMKGVIEEKTNRIVEVIISSVKPFQLMMGKIVGIAMVGITQFVIWVVLVSVLSGPVSALVMQLMHVDTTAVAESAGAAQGVKMGGGSEIFEALADFNFPLLIGLFVFYFVGGYLFYGALFAAVGSAVDNETDTQQFMMPITLPLIFSIAIAQAVINAPNSTLSIWLSMIPFSSPVIMMVRLPFGIPPIQIIASMACMIAGFILTVWFAGRIYRIGILTYGKKPTYKELFKWLFRKG